MKVSIPVRVDPAVDRGPTDEQMIQAVLFLLEGHAVPPRYVVRLRELLDAQDRT